MVTETVEIRYREFSDLPRVFVAAYRGKTFLFESAFNEELDDYPDDYEVFVLPDEDLAARSGSWAGLSEHAVCRLGRIPVTAISFDPTRRNSIDGAILRSLAARCPSQI